MEEQEVGVDTEEGALAQHFYIPALKVEGFMGDCGRGINERLVTGTA